MVQELIDQGKNVTVVPRATHKTADFIIDGVTTELKTLTQAGTNTLKNSIEKAAQQGQSILIDARNVNYSSADALDHIKRAEGNIGSLKGRITVLTKDGAVHR